MTKHASRHANIVTKKSNRTSKLDCTRNPWLVDQNYSTNAVSTTSSQGKTPTRCTLSGPGPPEYLENVTENHLKCYDQDFPKSVTMPRLKNPKKYSNYGNHIPSVRPDHVTVPFHKNRSKFYDHTSAVNSACSTSRTSTDRPVTPASSSTTDGIVDPCGGHCRTFERCCHYLLQIFFMIGILSGVSLVLAAYWLHNQQRGSDQLVLVYIGVLMALVCTLLLSIQCSVEREVKRKKKSRRALLTRNRAHLTVPMKDLGAHRFGNTRDADEAVVVRGTYCEMPLMYNPYYHETQGRSYDEMSQSQNGIPWWRRYEMEVTAKNDNIV